MNQPFFWGIPRCWEQYTKLLTSNVPTTSQTCPKMSNPVPRTCQAFFAKRHFWGTPFMSQTLPYTCQSVSQNPCFGNSPQELAFWENAMKCKKYDKLIPRPFSNASQRYPKTHNVWGPSQTPLSQVCPKYPNPSHHIPNRFPSNIPKPNFENFWDMFGLFLFPPTVTFLCWQLWLKVRRGGTRQVWNVTWT
jgi:hypothetical protein